MRILRIRFKNLNSLVGEWVIDFTHAAYTADGIFAITGPTGAGKTTILDAICLGLFGQTPRLNKITTTNEIMSRQTGECFAEVTFETAEGRYRCHWSQHRARKKPDGALQSAKHEIADADTNRVLDAKLKTVAAKVESVTGMNFDRFTRSSLLAQGHFAAFLNARPDERGPILEQITGTDIYSKISKAVHERRSAELTKLDAQSAKLDDLVLLDSDAERALAKEVDDQKTQIEGLKQTRTGCQAALTWLQTIQDLTRQIEENDKLSQEFQKEKADAAPKLKELLWAEKALPLESAYAALDTLRQAQRLELSNLDQIRRRLPERSNRRQKVIQEQSDLETHLSQAKQEQKAGHELFKDVRRIDTEIEQVMTVIEKHKTNLETNSRERDAYARLIEQSKAELNDIDTSIQECIDYADDHREDAALLEEFTGMKHRFTNIERLHDGVTQHTKRHAAVEKDSAAALSRLQEASAAKAKAQDQVTDLRQKRDQHQAHLDKTRQGRSIAELRKDLDGLHERLDGLRRASDVLARLEKSKKRMSHAQSQAHHHQSRLGRYQQNLEASKAKLREQEQAVETLEEKDRLLDRIRSLEDERQRLVDGKPCPLCGAITHPFATHEPALEDETKQALTSARAALAALLAEVEATNRDIIGCQKDIDQAQDTMSEQKDLCDQQDEVLAEILKSLDLAEPAESRPETVARATEECARERDKTNAVLTDIEACQDAISDATKALEAALADLSDCEQATQKRQRRVDQLQDEREKLEQTLDQTTRDLDAELEVARRVLAPFGIDNFEAEQTDAVLDVLTRKRDAWKRNRQQHDEYTVRKNELTNQRDRAQAALDQITKSIEEKQKELDSAGADVDALTAERRDRFGDGDPDKEEKKMADRITTIEAAIETKRRETIELEKEVAQLERQRDDLEGTTTERQHQIETQQAKFEQTLKKLEFEDEERFLSARRSTDELETLKDLRDQLNGRELEIATQAKELKDRLQRERAKHITDREQEALEREISELDASIDAMHQSIGAKTQKLEDNENKKKRREDQIQILEAQKKETERWNQLHTLIGSADGKKFRNIAQGITFDVMIGHANTQLRKMSDRYILIRDDTEPLNLNVVDDYQAGEIRSTKNLSGGEGFIVSLALALGLAQMASRRVQVNSLFLDEGFGTLDDESLETALETLASLQQSGKSIAVISHVGALKERIPTQIVVTPTHSGISRVSGPGVRHL